MFRSSDQALDAWMLPRCSLANSVYLPALYQALLTFFSVLVQLVIGLQWLALVPGCQVHSLTVLL